MANISQITLPDGTTYDLKDVDSESYAPKASPALTGTPTAPTATSGTNSTQIATTAFVQGAVSSAIGNVNSFEVSVVQSLPTTNIDPHTIYFISNSGSTGNIYDEYMYINSNWEKIGTTDVDLSGYLAKNNTTAFTPTGDYNPATKKYVDDKLFVVNITSTTTEGVTTYTADKTFAQITAAVEAGKQVTAINNNYVYYYTWKNNSNIIFHSKTLTVFGSNSQITNRTFRIHNDEVVSLYTNTFQNKLTFDSTPTENSTNPVTSGGVYTALANAGSTPDWEENDTTSSSYIQNRTHYTEDPVMTEVWTHEVGTNTYYEVKITDSDWINNLEVGTPYSITFNGSTYTGDFRLTEDEYVEYVAGSTNDEFTDNIPFMLFINPSNYYGYLVIEEGVVSSTANFSLSIYTSVIHKLDDKYLNGSLIKSGTGTQSEIFNGIAPYETYQIYITGDANTVEYTFATSGQMPPEELSYCVSAIKVEGHNDIEVVNIEFDSDHNHYGITFNKTFVAELPVEDYPINIIVPSRIASGDYSHLEGDARYALGVASHAEGSSTTASGDYSHAEGNNTKAFGYISHAEGNGTTASGNYSHAEGSNTTASDNSAHAEGNGTTASGSMSHAEGAGTTAFGNYSHAEGYSSTASGNYSHAEGYHSTASGNYSHAEGYNSPASGNYSHAEGYNSTASGSMSHAEGAGTTAFGNYSHAEGAGTIAQRRSQHVFGEYNVLDTTGASKSSKGSYIEIVGKGTSDANRSNARTLDWSGNEVLAGKLTVGAAPTNNMDVTTKQYVDNAVSSGGGSSTLVDLTDTTISSPTNGQVLMYNSTTSKWENTSLPIYNGGVSSS